MKYLLDTHTFLWWATDSSQLSDSCQQVLSEADEVLLSVVTAWELQIKQQAGKLNLTLPLRQLLQEQMAQNQLRLLPVRLEHILALEQFPLHHRDPFDRLLAAQAQVEGATLLTADAAFAAYAIPTCGNGKQIGRGRKNGRVLGNTAVFLCLRIYDRPIRYFDSPCNRSSFS